MIVYCFVAILQSQQWKDTCTVDHAEVKSMIKELLFFPYGYLGLLFACSVHLNPSAVGFDQMEVALNSREKCST